MQLDRRAIESSLKKKGFTEDNQGHHRYFHHEYNGKRTGVYTYTSRGSSYKTYGDSLLKEMHKQLRLDSIRQLADLVNCPMSRDNYEAHLKSKSVIPKQAKRSQTESKRSKSKKRHRSGRCRR